MQIPFAIRFPHLAPVSLCQLMMDHEVSDVNGLYNVIDCYCEDPECDCQKVSLAIADRRQTVYATIAYGWESAAYYRKWGLDRQTSQALTQGFLDPLGQQSKHADLFLEAFLHMVKDPHFISQIKSRYGLFKKSLGISQF